MPFLFRPIDIASLSFFRLLFGILAFIDVTSTLTYKHWYKNWLDSEGFHFKYYGFTWVGIPDDPWLSIFLISLMIASFCIAIGYHYRIAAIYFAFGFTYTFLMEKAFYLNHGYFLCVLSFLMIFLPAHRNFSLDIFRRPSLYRERVPFWSLFLLQFMMGVVYFFGGIAKINGDWLRAQPLKIWLKAKSDRSILGPLLEPEATAYFMSYGGLMLDLFVAFFLLSKRTRVWAFCFVLFFHLTNVLIFEIGVFPWLSISLTALFFAPNFPRQIFAWLQRRLPSINWAILPERWEMRLAEKGIAMEGQTLLYSPVVQKRISWAIGIFCLIQLALPLRHHLFPGKVAWTEEGHRYSWRMMLRSKRGYGHFIVRDGVTGEEEKIKPRKWLNDKQGYKLYTHPDMILQFAHHLRDHFSAEGMQEVEVYAHIKTRLNDHPYQAYIDKEVDLATKEWPLFSSKSWIVPYQEEEVEEKK